MSTDIRADLGERELKALEEVVHRVANVLADVACDLGQEFSFLRDNMGWSDVEIVAEVREELVNGDWQAFTGGRVGEHP